MIRILTVKRANRMSRTNRGCGSRSMLRLVDGTLRKKGTGLRKLVGRLRRLRGRHEREVMQTMRIAPPKPIVRTRPARPRPAQISFEGSVIHMVGVGGCGMRAAARLLLQCGARVSGSDQKLFDGIGPLKEFGAKISIGQDASNLPPGVTLVVHSAAVPEHNEELRAARACGCRVIKYAELLGELMRLRKGVAVAGTHGKSTTTAMTAYLFKMAGLAPSYVVGANVPQLGGGAGVGMGEHFIVEACEFDRSFLNLQPRQAAILNVEADHLDCYADIDEITEAFTTFANGVESNGLIVARHEDVRLMQAVAHAQARVETFGFASGATWRAVDLSFDKGRYAFCITYEDQHLFRTSIALAGRHNIANALVAVALAWNAGATRDVLAEALTTFEGVDRRMTECGRARGVIVIDDYAHHPTEVSVTLEALRERHAPKRLWVVFQPHQHSRTRILMDDFARSFGAADEIIVPAVYGSRDTAADARLTNAQDLVERIRKNGGSVTYMPTLEGISSHLENSVQEGDVVVTMGAGNVWTLAHDLAERLKRAG